MRRLTPISMFLFGVVLAGCELAVTFESIPEGTGASAGSSQGGAGATGGTSATTGGASGQGAGGTGGAAGTSGGAAGTSGGAAGTSGAGGTMMETCATGCDDQNPCTEDSCDPATSTCAHKPAPAGTDVSNNDPADCVKTVCDGTGATQLSPDDTETPTPDGAECHALICLNGAASPQPLNEGQPCAASVVPPCQQAALCTAGECKIMNAPDGNYKVGACGSVTCTNGMSSSVTLDAGACPDPAASECSGAVCNQDTTCGTVTLADGTACTKTSGFGGNCNAGHCCNGFGCD